jgi:hypothetical protein
MSLTPRRLFCVYEHRYRDRRVADAVVGGRFPIQGQTMDLGVAPDWLGAALPADREWRLEWSKFYYGLNLAQAFEETGDRRYCRAWIALVRSWIAQVPIDADSTDVLARRVQNWIYAWSRFAPLVDLDVASPGFAGAIGGSLARQVAHLEGHLTPERNHRTLELYALFAFALALPSLDAGGRLLADATAALAGNLLADVLPDGVQRERSTHYHHIVLRSFIGFRENARRFSLPVPAGFDARLTRACEFAMHCHRPDGGIPALSDGDGGSYLDLLALAGDLLGRPDFSYVASAGRVGTPPSSCRAAFPEGGYHLQRSGWGDRGRAFADERYLIFDCGPLGDGGHGHYDALNVEIAADGGPLTLDPGRFTYNDDPPHWRYHFKRTAAHNTLTVDDLDQTPYRRGKPKGPVATARLLQRTSADGLDLLCGEVRSPAYEAVHRRRILFVAGDYWLIEDTVIDVQPRRYRVRFHLAPAAQGTTRVSPTHPGTVAAPGVAIAGATGAALAIEDGWISQEYGIRIPAPVAVFSAEPAREARFLTLVAPLAPGVEPPIVTERRVEQSWLVEVRHQATGLRDDVMWTADDAGAPRFTASWRRFSSSGAPVASACVTAALDDPSWTLAAAGGEGSR